MRVPNLGEADILLPLHDGLFEQPMWRTFLARLRRVSGADWAGIAIGVDPAHGTADALFLDGTWPNGSFASDEEPMRILTIAHEDMADGRVYDESEMEAKLARHAGAGTLDVGTLRAVRLLEPEGIEAIVALAGTEELGPDVANLLVALSPHMRVAFRTIAALEQERVKSAANQEDFARMHFGRILLGAKCRILECDAQAERFLSRSRTLARGPHDRLVPRDPTVDRTITSLVRDFGTGAGGRPKAITLSRDPWVAILIAPLRHKPRLGSDRAVATVYLSGDQKSSANRIEQLIDLFGLTPSEARMAWSLAQGISIAEAARSHAITVETARYYSKRVYEKTGARGQVELIRHIMASVIALSFPPS